MEAIVSSARSLVKPTSRPTSCVLLRRLTAPFYSVDDGVALQPGGLNRLVGAIRTYMSEELGEA